jgi:hypothetical protein
MNLEFVEELYTEDTGGGFLCDVVILKDGAVLVIGEMSIVLYEDLDAWEDSRQSGQVGEIIRSVNA